MGDGHCSHSDICMLSLTTNKIHFSVKCSIQMMGTFQFKSMRYNQILWTKPWLKYVFALQVYNFRFKFLYWRMWAGLAYTVLQQFIPIVFLGLRPHNCEYRYLILVDSMRMAILYRQNTYLVCTVNKQLCLDWKVL